MMRSLYSGVAGLRTHQTKMDVIGNNIANVNTIGFKSSSTLFRDVLYQTTSNATGATATTGGTNASQIGLGTKMSSIQTNITDPGSAQSTNNPYDLMLSGSSFFVVSRGDGYSFTKVGNFQVDGAGCLVTSNGYQVMGWQVDPENPTNIKKDTVSALYPESVENKTAAPEQTSQAYVSGNVDLTDEDLTSVDGAAISLTIYDALGYSYSCKFKLTQDPGEVDKSLYNLQIISVKDSKNVEILGTDDTSTPNIQEGGYTATLGNGAAATDTIQIKFNADDGSFSYVGAAGQSTALLSIKPSQAGKADVFSSIINNEAVEGITIDFSEVTMFESDGTSTAKLNRGSIKSEGGGRSAGKLKGVTIDEAGMLFGTYSNGETKLLGQIAVANFTNPMALEAVGDSLYVTTQNSGDFDGIGSAVNEDGGKMSQGVLEMSNVDLSLEFTDMITTQRGFQANSRIITTSDTLLEELVNLKR
ncbi:MAG: flagellar hook protein FlgE [Clostridium sp.]|nr:flagellar hook protein FlgE [Clostridium sp.]MCM1398003.1 flagellar hook protein FlgE [Clostridium sp.]MCM1459361.1 flagellar hook protein FlgE [Bacteroides sp.]